MSNNMMSYLLYWKHIQIYHNIMVEQDHVLPAHLAVEQRTSSSSGAQSLRAACRLCRQGSNNASSAGLLEGRESRACSGSVSAAWAPPPCCCWRATCTAWKMEVGPGSGRPPVLKLRLGCGGGWPASRAAASAPARVPAMAAWAYEAAPPAGPAPAAAAAAAADAPLQMQSRETCLQHCLCGHQAKDDV